jgi:hypothetical protein
MTDIRHDDTLLDVLLTYHVAPPPDYTGGSYAMATPSDNVQQVYDYTLDRDWDPERPVGLKPWMWSCSHFERVLTETMVGHARLPTFTKLPLASTDPRPDSDSKVDRNDPMAVWADHLSFVWYTEHEAAPVAPDEGQIYDYIGDALMKRPLLIAKAVAEIHTSSVSLVNSNLIPRPRWAPNFRLSVQKHAQSGLTGRPDIAVVSVAQRRPQLALMSTEVKLHHIVGGRTVSDLADVNLPSRWADAQNYTSSQKWLVHVQCRPPFDLPVSSDERLLL